MLMLIKKGIKTWEELINFNTSHVNVNQINPQIISQAKANFNTSHVNVNRKAYEGSTKDKHFNTSHVNVNLSTILRMQLVD